MPYTTTRRNHNVFARKVERYFTYKKAKRMFNAINRDMMVLESRFLRSKLNQA